MIREAINKIITRLSGSSDNRKAFGLKRTDNVRQEAFEDDDDPFGLMRGNLRGMLRHPECFSDDMKKPSDAETALNDIKEIGGSVKKGIDEAKRKHQLKSAVRQMKGHIKRNMNDLTKTGFRGDDQYVASEDLLATVNIAMSLEKPLLVKGEPGTGKTKLAEAIAHALGKKLIIWNIKSTTKAQDGLYVYDVVQRLYDSQFGNAGVDDIAKYIKLGKLGEAFTSDEQVVLLIDEIDKADIEFPNDLLWELDKMEFNIPETGETITAKKRPVVIITSNAEKELPDAFLRRCIFHYIEFPKKEQMEEIIRVHFDELDKKLMEQAMAAFYMIRDIPNIDKKPSTSELIDWIRALTVGGVDPDMVKQYVPFAGVLLKKDKDIATLERSMR